MKHPLIFTAGAVVLSVVLIGSFLFAEEGEKENPFRVEIRGLRIVGEGYAKESSMNPFNWRPGTSISLLVRAEDDNIIAFDDDESKLKSARDSRGGDLLKKVGSGFGQKPGFGSFSKISADRKACRVEVNLLRLPSPDSDRIVIEGVMVFATATVKKDYELKDLPLRIDSKIAIEPAELVISKVETPSWQADKYPLAVTFKTSGEMETLEKVSFYDADGAEIESSPAGSSRSSFMGQVTTTQTYKLTEKIDTATVKFSFWEDWKKIPVPFSLNVGIGSCGE